MQQTYYYNFSKPIRQVPYWHILGFLYFKSVFCLNLLCSNVINKMIVLTSSANRTSCCNGFNKPAPMCSVIWNDFELELRIEILRCVSCENMIRHIARSLAVQFAVLMLCAMLFAVDILNNRTVALTCSTLIGFD